MPSSSQTIPSGNYLEKLWPGPSLWLSAIGASAVVGLIMLPIGAIAVTIGATIALVLTFSALVVSTPRVSFDGQTLRAGNASIDVEFLGEVSPIPTSMRRNEIGPGLDARAYLCFRSWIDGALRIELTDPADPTPYWIVSTRHPSQLADLLVNAIAARSSSATPDAE